MQNNQTIGQALKDLRIETITFFVDPYVDVDDNERSKKTKDGIIGFYYGTAGEYNKTVAMVGKEVNAAVMSWFEENQQGFMSGSLVRFVNPSEPCFVIFVGNKSGATEYHGKLRRDSFPHAVAAGLLDRPVDLNQPCPSLSPSM